MARTEEPNLLPGGQQRPADVLYIGIGKQGRDLAVDTTIVSTLTSGRSQSVRTSRGNTVGLSAKEAEKRKNVKYKERLQAVGIDFIPVGFETSGAQGSGFRAVIKKLSECAVQRRGHEKEYFERRWMVDIAMTIAKRGAQVAMRRAYAISVEQRFGFGAVDIEGDDGAPFGCEGSELPLMTGVVG